MSFTTITSFTEVVLIKDSFLVFDIDETILKYEHISRTWWKEKFEHYYSITNDYDKSNDLSLNDWKDYIHLSLPTHTDEEGFFDLIERSKENGCKVVFVTARHKEIENITHLHLKHLGIDNRNVYFTGRENKGVMIESILNGEHNNIIFIDDMDHNLIDVKEHFGNKVTCYKFVI